ncbi:hypothetical protein F157LOC_03497 [Pectobacterium brasiliense]|uniref:hypothetical protein n=1 Tax=Pectobacterium TaxID=122277 RepID=UPI000D49AA0E|nr:hypothetical protein [Pectobacterium brasiliense]PPE57477.1 hypothetical protein F157LOC_03497 [Pectobacterium brasiliense]
MSEYSTQKEKASLYLILLFISIAVVYGTLKCIEILQSKQVELLSAPFTPSENFDYSAIPSFIYFNHDKNEFFIKGALTGENEEKIFIIATSKCQGDKIQCISFSMFKSALTLIISKSDNLKNKLSELIFYIALLGGALGSILRLFIDFVGNASYKNTLDFKRWWPLYFTRPITGSILGLIVVVLLKSNIISLTLNTSHPESLWWLGLSIISGFGTIDATERLRLTSKAIFGENKKE